LNKFYTAKQGLQVTLAEVPNYYNCINPSDKNLYQNKYRG